MKTKIYRFFAIVPVVLCLVLGLIVPVRASAKLFNNTVVPTSSEYEPDESYYPDLSEYSSQLDSNYFLIRFYEIIDDTKPIAFCSFVHFSSSPNITPYSDHVDVFVSSTVQMITKYHSPYVTSSQSNNIYGFSYYFSTKELYCYSSSDHQSYFILGGVYGTHDVDTDLFDTNDSLNVTVEFQPDLFGSVDRTLDDNGVTTDSNFFQMTVTNNSKKNIQFRMAIVDSGTVGVIGRYHSETDRVAQASLHFEFIRKENYYECAYNQSEPLLVHGNCAWHFLGNSGAYNRYKFSWSQMDLEKGKQYDVVVWAIPTEQDYCSLIHYPFDSSSPVGGVYTAHSIDFDRQEEVYRSTFTLSSSTVYNPDDDSFGNVSFKNGESIDFDSLTSYRDANGQTHSCSFSLSDIVSGNLVNPSDHVYNGGHAGASHSRDTVYNINTGQFESVSSSFNTPYSVNNLSSSISNFGAFLQSIFSYFPSGVFAIFNLALVMVVVIAIIKVVR